MSWKLMLSLGLLAGSLVNAANITVHNTGVNGSDVVQTGGAATSFWTLLSAPTSATEVVGSTPFQFNCCYYADNGLSAWVSPNASGNASVNGNYVYQLMIDLTGFDPSTTVISGTFGTDNDGSISVNGSAAAATTCFGCFGAPTAFTLNSGFVSGLNSIRVTVDNGGNPTAFRVEFSSATANLGSSVPEPGTFLLLSGGLAAIGLLRKRIRG